MGASSRWADWLAVGADSTCTAARWGASVAAASYSRKQRTAVCGVRHDFQNYIQWSGIEITILCQSEHQKIPPHPKYPLLKMHFISSRNPMFLAAVTIHTKGDISDMPSMQPAEQIYTSPPGWRVPEHMPRRHFCICLPEYYVLRAMATGALEA